MKRRDRRACGRASRRKTDVSSVCQPCDGLWLDPLNLTPEQIGKLLILRIGETKSLKIDEREHSPGGDFSDEDVLLAIESSELRGRRLEQIPLVVAAADGQVDGGFYPRTVCQAIPHKPAVCGFRIRWRVRSAVERTDDDVAPEKNLRAARENIRKLAFSLKPAEVFVRTGDQANALPDQGRDAIGIVRHNYRFVPECAANCRAIGPLQLPRVIAVNVIRILQNVAG